MIHTGPTILPPNSPQSRIPSHHAPFPQYKADRGYIKPCRPCRATTLTDRNGESFSFDKATIQIGSSKDADIRPSGSNISPQHAEVKTGEGRTTCKALVGSEEDILADTFTWIDGNQLRHGVPYLLGSSCKLAFGAVENEYIIEFEQAKGGSGALEMLVRGMAAGASKKVQDNLDL